MIEAFLKNFKIMAAISCYLYFFRGQICHGPMAKYHSHDYSDCVSNSMFIKGTIPSNNPIPLTV